MTAAWIPALIALAVTVVPVASSRARLLRACPGTAGVPRARAGRSREGAGGDVPRSRKALSAASGLAVGVVLTFVAAWPAGLGAAVITTTGAYRVLGRSSGEKPTDPLRLAAGWDLLAAGLRAGLPVPVTVRAVAAEFTGTAGSALLEVADRLLLGSDPVSAWEPALSHPDTAELARAARRTARTGSGLAAVADDVAAGKRASVGQSAQARVQRAAVWVAAPLGLCFLPAFLCLGVLPVVVGMVEQMRVAW